ncbi:hypothetical protein chiPu_0016545 [Chiloscyllium punctatum]|uniref:Protein NATD1 n=1 Tax=Chiloscyllium punctatum TaxID=137246 RepID=A0A401T616_CHIPU|nr:hypothetical protein [Chiloscyllium punctatum]
MGCVRKLRDDLIKILDRSPTAEKHKSPLGDDVFQEANEELEPNKGNSRDEAVLRYKYIGKKMVDLYSTQVPVKFRGQGIGVRLAQAAMNFVVEEDLKVRTSCWFVKKYLDDNPLPNYAGRIVK